MNDNFNIIYYYIINTNNNIDLFISNSVVILTVILR